MDPVIDKTTLAIRNAITEAVQAGINHAIATITIYAATHPVAQPHCDQLAATLRDQRDAIGTRHPE